MRPSRRRVAAWLAALTLVLALASSCMPGRELFLPPRPLSRADAIVVLGNRPPLDAGGEVAPETERRVRRGVELYERGLAPILVVTGGSVQPTEAEVMARRAEELGVPREAILVEDRARDTPENARLSVEALCRGRTPCHPRVIVVTSPHHLRRAVALFRCAGADVQHAAAELAGDYGQRVAFTAIEYGARIAYVFDDACARARPR